VRLRGVLEHGDAEIGQFGGPPVEMHRDHRARRRRARGRGRVGVDGRGLGIDVDRHGNSTRRAHGRCSRHGGERRHDHLVAGTDAEGEQRDAERLGAGGDRNRVAPSERGRELALEGLGLGTEQDAPRCEHARAGLGELGLERSEAASEIDDREP